MSTNRYSNQVAGYLHTCSDEQLARFAQNMLNLTRKPAETDDELRERVIRSFGNGSPAVLTPPVETWPPAVYQRINEALYLLGQARVGGYFDKWWDAPGVSFEGRLYHCATAANALLNDPCLEVRVVGRRDGSVMEISPRWEAWVVAPRPAAP